MFRSLLLLSSVAFSAEVGLTQSSDHEPPNIVVIVADDLGWNCVGYHNEEFLTPNIDQLAESGIKLSQFRVAPMCSPTRAGLLTGRFPIRFGAARAVIPPYRDFGLPVDEVTLAEALGKIGYPHRGIFGKWHLGHRRAKWHPLMRGFTHFRGHYNGAIDYFALSRDGVRDWHAGFDNAVDQGYSTNLIAENAASWITQVAAEASPFFCYVPFNAPHSPFQVPDETLGLISDWEQSKGIQNRGVARRKAEANRLIYKSMIYQMDQGIGRILEALRATGEEDNTLVLFFSDNGGVGSLRGLNDPLRGSKLTVFEGGVRVPALIRWPKRIEANADCTASIGYVDVLPTLLAAAGVHAEDVVEKPLDGMNFIPLLKPNPEDDVRAQFASRAWYSYHGQQGEEDEHLAVQKDGWKLVVRGPRLSSADQLFDGSAKVSLFHLEQDPHELRDVMPENRDRVASLGALLVEHRNLQPANAVPAYRVGAAGFIAPENWQLDPESPDKLVGHHSSKSN